MFVLKEIEETPQWDYRSLPCEDVSLVCCSKDLPQIFMFISNHYNISAPDLEALQEYFYVHNVPRASDNVLVNLDIEEVMELYLTVSLVNCWQRFVVLMHYIEQAVRRIKMLEEKKHYWLASVSAYKAGDLLTPLYVGENNFSTTKKHLTQDIISQVKDGVIKLVNDKHYKGDVYCHILSINFLGEMTEAEWEN